MTGRWGRGGWLVGFVLIGGCGGRASGPKPWHEGDAGSPAGGAPGEAGASSAAIIDNAPLASGGVGGEGPSNPVQLIDSATRYCESESECFGQACVAPSTLPAVCAVPCETNDDCWRDEICVNAAKGSHCYPPCDSPEDCAYAFDCFRFDENVDLICFPAPWAIGWR